MTQFKSEMAEMAQKTRGCGVCSHEMPRKAVPSCHVQHIHPPEVPRQRTSLLMPAGVMPALLCSRRTPAAGHRLSVWSSAALVQKVHRLRAGRVARVEVVDDEAAALKHERYWPIQLAAAADALPGGRQAVLPFTHTFVRRETVLDEEQVPVRF